MYNNFQYAKVIRHIHRSSSSAIVQCCSMAMYSLFFFFLFFIARHYLPPVFFSLLSDPITELICRFLLYTGASGSCDILAYQPEYVRFYWQLTSTASEVLGIELDCPTSLFSTSSPHVQALGVKTGAACQTSEQPTIPRLNIIQHQVNDWVCVDDQPQRRNLLENRCSGTI